MYRFRHFGLKLPIQLPMLMLIDGVHITPVKSVRDLGIYIDADLSMRMHVQ